ncbi:MAG TPA: M28 family peptidase [Candidatus Eisenbacteria bacterium]
MRRRPGRFVIRFLFLAMTAAAGLSTNRRALASDDDIGLDAITAERIRRHVAVLASDAYGGRLPGTAGEDSTLAYLEREYRALGLEPAVNGSYRQRVPLVKRTVLPTPTMSLHRIGNAKGAVPSIAWGEDLTIGSNRLDETLALHDAELVFVGYGITAPELGWDDYAGVDMKGKVALALSADPGRVPADSNLFGGRGLTHYGLSQTKQEMAAAHGAVGVITMHDQEIVGYPYNLLTASAGRGRYDLVASGDALPKTPFGGTFRKEIVQAILTAAGHDPAVLMESAGRRGFRAVPLGIALDLEARLRIERSESYNFLGLLRGREHPDEVVAYSAHWDHVGIGVPVDGDSIYNGAIDNATGTAALLTLAKAYRSRPEPPARSVLFWATTCEEQGLLGSYHYADNPVVPLNKTVALINMDALFPFGKVGAIVVTGYGQTELEDLLVEASKPEDRVVLPDDNPEAGAYFRSDHYPMAKKGVPSIFGVGNPVDDSDSTLMARFTGYVQTGYHKPKDELTDDWDLAGIVQDVRSFYRLGAGLADGTAWPNFRATSEFRHLRDAMMRR